VFGDSASPPGAINPTALGRISRAEMILDFFPGLLIRRTGLRLRRGARRHHRPVNRPTLESRASLPHRIMAKASGGSIWTIHRFTVAQIKGQRSKLERRRIPLSETPVILGAHLARFTRPNDPEKQNQEESGVVTVDIPMRKCNTTILSISDHHATHK